VLLFVDSDPTPTDRDLKFESLINQTPIQGCALISRKNCSDNLVVLSNKARCLCLKYVDKTKFLLKEI
jgi:hypothetical protein